MSNAAVTSAAESQKTVIYEKEEPRLECVKIISHPALPLITTGLRAGALGCHHLECLCTKGPEDGSAGAELACCEPQQCVPELPATRTHTPQGQTCCPAAPPRPCGAGEPRAASRSTPRGQAPQPALCHSCSQRSEDRPCWENTKQFAVGTEALVCLCYAISCVRKYAVSVRFSQSPLPSAL